MSEQTSPHDHSRDGSMLGGTSCGPFLTSRAGLVLIGFLALAGVYLWMEHRVHFLGALVWLPLLACPLMHLFMHHGHGGHAAHTTNNREFNAGEQA
jgi:hypothetical protein